MDYGLEQLFSILFRLKEVDLSCLNVDVKIILLWPIKTTFEIFSGHEGTLLK